VLTTKYVRNLVYAGPGEVIGELGDRDQHLLRRDSGIDGMEIHNKGENSEQQEVASHHWGGDGQSEGYLFPGLKYLKGTDMPIRQIGHLGHQNGTVTLWTPNLPRSRGSFVERWHRSSKLGCLSHPPALLRFLLSPQVKIYK
jgi:hypothetical protein